MLKAHGDWMELGSADEQKPAKEGSVEGDLLQLTHSLPQKMIRQNQRRH
jgi:hypothetical protein